MSKAERDLIKAGYHFSGHYTRDKDEAAERARKYREAGHRARVVPITSKGRVYTRYGYSVYVKESEAGQ